MGAAADRDPIGVAGDEAGRLERHAEPFADELGEARLVALALGGDADDELDGVVGLHRDLGFLARHAGRDIDVVAAPHAAIFAALLGLGAAALEAGPAAELERGVHGADIVAVVVFDAD